MFTPKEGEVVIHLNKGYQLLINAEDKDLLQDGGKSWYVHETKLNKYAAREILLEDKSKYRQYAHRLITAAGEGLVVDHLNHNGLDCTRDNLRVTTYSINNQNKSWWPTGESGYRGVRKVGKRWTSRISFQGNRVSLGGFSTAEEAARAYDAKALELYGPYAWTNFKKNNRVPLKASEPIPF